MAYLTVVEYVARFGERETTLLTNSESPLRGAIITYDAAKVETAICDATQEVEGYIATRYATPLETAPPIVKGWVAALTRLRLTDGTMRPNDAIKDAADRATRQLEQMVAGKINLPVPEGGTAPTPYSTGDALSSNDAPCPTLGTLDAFTAPFTGGYDCLPAWRRGC